MVEEEADDLYGDLKVSSDTVRAGEVSGRSLLMLLRLCVYTFTLLLLF